MTIGGVAENHQFPPTRLSRNQQTREEHAFGGEISWLLARSCNCLLLWGSPPVIPPATPSSREITTYWMAYCRSPTSPCLAHLGNPYGTSWAQKDNDNRLDCSKEITKCRTAQCEKTILSKYVGSTVTLLNIMPELWSVFCETQLPRPAAPCIPDQVPVQPKSQVCN